MFGDEFEAFDEDGNPLPDVRQELASRRLTREGKRALGSGVLGMISSPPVGPIAFDDPPDVEVPLGPTPWVLVPDAVVESVSSDEIRLRLPPRFVSVPAADSCAIVREGERVSLLVLADGRVSVRPSRSKSDG